MACQAVVVLLDLQVQKMPAERELMRVFRLTPAEIRLATRLLQEPEGLRAVARRLGIAYETARNVEKRILGKTGTRNQGQLIGLLARMANQLQAAAP
jgi:DNA-binding CsgD family transcriptional regulator